MLARLNILALKVILFAFFLLLGPFFIKPAFADWPMYKYDYQRSGLSPYTLSQKPEVKWISPNISFLTQPPTVDSDQNLYVPTGYKLYKLSHLDGSVIWSFNNSNSFPNNGPVFDDNDNLYFATSGCNPFLYSLTKSGTLRWSYDLRQGQGLCGDYSASSSFTISKDKTTLYVGVGRPFYGILALDLNGNVKFKKFFSFESPGEIAIDQNNNLIVTTGRYLFSLSPTGTTIWSYPLTGNFNGLSIPSIGPDNNIYLTTSSNYNTNNFLHSFTLSGQKRWSYPTTNIMRLSSPALKDTKVYFTGQNNLFAVNTLDGTLLWKWTAPVLVPDSNLTTPVIDKNGVIYSTYKDTIYAISPDGNLNWQIPLNQTLGQLIIPKDETIYVTRQEGFKGYVTALENTTPTKTPVLFIPGIGGSELKVTEDTNWSAPDAHGGTYTRNYSKDEKVWLNEPEARAIGNDDYFDVLRMQPNGITSEISLSLTGNLVKQYQPAIDFFANNGYTFGKDFSIFPYDWRDDINEKVDSLDQAINFLKQTSHSNKVDIVSHSMGGLVAKNYIKDAHKAQNVNKFISLGTPYLGSVSGLKSIYKGTCLTTDSLKDFPFCLGLSTTEVNDVMKNMISGYELAPSQKYYHFYSGSDNNHPLPFRDDRDIDNNNIKGPLNYSQTKDLLTNLGHNTSLFTPAENFHNLDDQLSNTNGVDTTIIAGSGINTLGQIIEKFKFDFAGIKIPEKDELKVSGDDTVPIFSASLEDPSQNLSLKGNAKVFYTKQSHGSLSGNGPAMNLVSNILNDDSTIPQGISNTPFPLNGKQLSVHSPINIHVYDSLGNHTGPLPNGDFEANIPGSSYDTLDDAKFIFLPEEGIYEIKFEATDQGSFDFKIRNYNNDINDKLVLYKDIPLSQNTEAETTLDTNSSQPPTLSLDQNGDGEIDLELNASSVTTGDDISDTTPPQTEINKDGILGNNDWYKSDVKVTLNPLDDDSGILKTEYSIDDGLVKTYFEPFIISEGQHKLKVKSTDNTGNEEEIQELQIKIDKTAPMITLSANPNILWPPDGKMVDVLINGSSRDINNYTLNFTIRDEYNQIDPHLEYFGQTIKLQASRMGSDIDGRVYKITARAEDLAGNLSYSEINVIVPHDKTSY